MKHWNIEQIAVDRKQAGCWNFSILLLTHALCKSIQHSNTQTSFCVHIFVHLHTCSISIQVFNLLECYTKWSLVCRANTTSVVWVNAVFFIWIRGHKMDKGSKKSKHRNSLEAGWKGKMEVALTVCTRLSLTKTTYSNNPIVSITTRLVHKKD